MFPVSFCKLLLLFWLAFSCCETKHLLTGSSDQTITDRWQSVVYSFQQRVVVIQTPFKMSIQPHMQSTLTKKMEQSILFIAGQQADYVLTFLGMCWCVEECERPLAARRRFDLSASPPRQVELHVGRPARRTRHVPEYLHENDEWQRLWKIRNNTDIYKTNAPVESNIFVFSDKVEMFPNSNHGWSTPLLQTEGRRN